MPGPIEDHLDYTPLFIMLPKPSFNCNCLCKEHYGGWGLIDVEYRHRVWLRQVDDTFSPPHSSDAYWKSSYSAV